MEQGLLQARVVVDGRAIGFEKRHRRWFSRWKDLLEVLREKNAIVDGYLLIFLTRYYKESEIWLRHRNEIRNEAWY